MNFDNATLLPVDLNVDSEWLFLALLAVILFRMKIYGIFVVFFFFFSKLFGSFNFFGGSSQVSLRVSPKLRRLEAQHSESMFVIMADLWLDKPVVSTFSFSFRTTISILSIFKT